jgi:hypothetical protein
MYTVGYNFNTYSDGWVAGKHDTLLKLQSELSALALDSKVNANKSRSENMVLTLSDVEKVIYKMLEET